MEVSSIRFSQNCKFIHQQIDLFASALNHQVPKYISRDQIKKHLQQMHIISKIEREGSPGVMIIPLWNIQFWFPMMVSLLQDFPVILPPNILALPFNQDQQYLLYPKINCWQFIYQQIPQTSKHSTRNYRCYPGVVQTNHKVKI